MNPPFSAESLPRLLADYTPRPGVYDELIDPTGQVRPRWEPFLQYLNGLGADELNRRHGQAQRQITRDGFTFNPFDADGEVSRPWALDAIPLLLTEAEWQPIQQGLAQRARLYDRILRDLFGPQELLKEKLLPPEALFAHPAYHPAYHTLYAHGGTALQMFGADLARSPDGRFWVTGDRSRAPFGLGYVLENRIITSRMLPQPFRQMNVERLAGFFISLKAMLTRLAPRSKENPRIAVWTKGPSSRAYFEDAYLARYLGYQLVEGGDLAVRENRVQIKTLSKLLSVEVLFRRLDDEACDPVELDGNSLSGVAGLLEVIRSGNVAIANSLGSRLVESPLFMAYLPGICRRLEGQDLLIPSVATWWCGDPRALKEVLGRLETLLIRRAYRMGDTAPIRPGLLSKEERARLIEEMKTRPEQFVAQETVVRSTTPIWSGDRAVPWSLTVRGFVVDGEEGYETLPGGLARVAPDPTTLEKSMTTGEYSQDIWILSEGPILEKTLLNQRDDAVELRRTGAELPSRVADNLFWLGRYVERAEATARLLRTVVILLMGESESDSQTMPFLRGLAEQGQLDPDYVIPELSESMPALEIHLPKVIADHRRPKSLRSCIQQSMRLVSSVRDRLSVDAWRIIHRINEASLQPARDLPEVLEYLDRATLDLVSFSGLGAESMTRTQGWRFLDLGRRIERAWQTATLLRATLASVGQEEASVLESVLRTCDCIMTYRSRYLATVRPAAVLDLLVMDETNPRSIVFQLAHVSRHVDELPRTDTEVVRTPEQRLALSLVNAVRLADVFEISKEFNGSRDNLERLLKRLCDQLPHLSNALSSRFLIHAGLSRHYASTEASS